jgi:hypothetical protein
VGKDLRNAGEFHNSLACAIKEPAPGIKPLPVVLFVLFTASSAIFVSAQ